MNKLLTTLLLVTVTSFTLGQTKLISKVDKKKSDFDITYQKYVLPNGLTVVVHEDHSDPIVYVDVTYHVGSAREQEGRSGFAHFFEHMMFQGSKNVGDEQHFKFVSEAGGQLNGTTNIDRTNYFETLPSNQLETALWLEADRMGFLLDSVTQQKFEIQRATVKNERGQNYDNKPYGVVQEKIGEALYPSNHPYAWTTIGYIEDLNRVNVNDLKNFFLRWYGPNNAVLTVAGDVNTAEVLKLAEKYFGPIKRGPEVTPQTVAPVKLDKNRYISYEDNVRMPQLVMAFPTVPNTHPDAPALQVLADLLSGSNNTPFYQNFVKSEKAVAASTFNRDAELAGVFQIIVRAYPDTKLSDMEDLIYKTLQEFEKKGVTPADIKTFNVKNEVSLIEDLSSVQGKGSTMASYQTFNADPNYLTVDVEKFRNVKPEDVIRVYNTYIKDKNAVILSVCPKGKSDLVAKPNNFEKPTRTIQTESPEYKNLTYNIIKDNFDRSKKPLSGPNPTIKVPQYYTSNFANGLKVIGNFNDEVPMVNLTLNMKGGHRFETPSKSGIAQLTASLMNESTTKHTSEELEELLNKLGSSIAIRNGSEEIQVYVSTLAQNLDATLELLKEKLFEPKFSQEEFDLFKKQQIEGIKNQSTQPAIIADNVFAKLLYGNENTMSIPSSGTTKTVESITLEDVKNYYNQTILPNNASLVISGKISKEEILNKTAFLQNWKNQPLESTVVNKTPSVDKTRIYFVNKDKAPQAQIRIGYIALPFDATGDFYKSKLMNYPLAGSFNSRINLNLREKRGFTYGAKGGFTGTKFAGPLSFYAGVKIESTDSSVIEFMKEIKNYADNGVTQEELAYTKSSIGQSEALKYETAQSRLGFIKNILDYNLANDFVAKQNEILKNLSKTEVDALAKKMLTYDKMIIVIVGDKAKVWDKINKLGYEVIELDTEGNPLK